MFKGKSIRTPPPHQLVEKTDTAVYVGFGGRRQTINLHKWASNTLIGFLQKKSKPKMIYCTADDNLSINTLEHVLQFYAPPEITVGVFAKDVITIGCGTHRMEVRLVHAKHTLLGNTTSFYKYQFTADEDV